MQSQAAREHKPGASRLLLLLLPLPPPPPLARAEDAARTNSDRYAVYWNRSNPR